MWQVTYDQVAQVAVVIGVVILIGYLLIWLWTEWED